MPKAQETSLCVLVVKMLKQCLSYPPTGTNHSEDISMSPPSDVPMPQVKREELLTFDDLEYID